MGSFFSSTLPRLDVRRGTSLDLITYLASLASRPSDIDSTLDTLRKISARLRPGQAPSASDTRLLAKVYFDLETYLVNDEPLRAYTLEGLRSKVAEKFDLGTESVEHYWQSATNLNEAVQTKSVAASSTLKAGRARRAGHWIIAVALLFGITGFFIPVTATPDMPWSNNFDMTFSLMGDVLLFGGAWLFLAGLPGFKARLRTSYRMLCAAMVLLALAQSQQIIYTYLNLWDNPFILHGGVALGFAPPIILFYVSMLLFAKLLHVKNFFSSIVAALITCVVAAALAAAFPYFPSPLSPEVLRQALPPSILLDTFLVFAVGIAWGIKRVAAPAYTPALAWLLLGIASIAATALIYTGVQVLLPEVNAVLSYGGISALFIVSGLLLIKSAVMFNLIADEL